MNENDFLCSCSSGDKYQDCCKKYHDGKDPENAYKLMRSRYSAYAMNLVDYIIKTTHPTNIAFKKELSSWKNEIEDFCKSIDFEKLEILDFTEEKKQAFVTFIAYLKSNNKDVSFTEISHFEKKNGKWLYKDGQIFSGAQKDV